MEYVIELNNQWAVLTGAQVQWTRTYDFGSVIRNKGRAQAIASKIGGQVQLFFGSAQPQGTKRFVAPVQSKINRNTPYRSI